MPRRCRPEASFPSSAFAGFRFPPEIIVVAVGWYLRFGLSYRDVEELLLDRGIEVDHVTVFRWVQRFTPQLAEAARPCRHAVGDRWFVDETYVKVAGRWRYVYRAIDQYGQIVDASSGPSRCHRRPHVVLVVPIGWLVFGSTGMRTEQPPSSLKLHTSVPTDDPELVPAQE
jgi:hypothetical protein